MSDDDTRSTRPQTPLPDAAWQQWQHLSDRLDRMHTEAKAMRAEQAQRNQETHDTLVRHQLKLEEHSSSLNAGSARFADMEKKIVPRWSTILTIVGAAAGVIWMASRYPDQGKFEALRDEVQQMKLESVELKRDVKETGQQLERLETKVDRLLSRPANGVNTP